MEEEGLFYGKRGCLVSADDAPRHVRAVVGNDCM